MAREQKRVSLEDLGYLSEVNWTTIGKIERGSSSPNVETLIRIATALDTDPGSFISGLTADQYGERRHQVTARDLISARKKQ